jgi:hypothetical protein
VRWNGTAQPSETPGVFFESDGALVLSEMLLQGGDRRLPLFARHQISRRAGANVLATAVAEHDLGPYSELGRRWFPQYLNRQQGG